MTSAGRVRVIGAQGALGRAVVEQFASVGWTTYPAGRRPGRSEGFIRLDLDRPETVLPALRDVDLVISTVPHPGHTVERLTLEHGGVLVNCSHARAETADSLTRAAKTIKGTVLLNGGLVPGIANLAAAELLARHGEADCLEVVFTILSSGTAGRAGGRFAHEGLTSRSRHRVATLPLPEPFGELPCIEISRGDDLGFGGVAGARRVETYLGFGDRALNLGLRAANSLHLMRLLPETRFATDRGKGNEVSKEPSAVLVGVRRQGERLGASILEGEGEYRLTALAAHAFGEALLADPQPGCFNPEDLFSMEEICARLGSENLRISQGTSKVP